jgi:glycosyltransferase involved in cell wall biosynthesis
MRILNLVPQYLPYMGGAAVYVHEMAKRFVRDGHRVDVFTTNAWDLDYLFYPGREHREPGEETIDGVRVRRFRVTHLLRGKGFWKPPRRMLDAYSWALFRKQFAIVPGLWRALLCSGGRYDIIHATPNPHFYLISPARALARRQGIPFVLTPFIHVGLKRGESQLHPQASPRRVAAMNKSDALIVQTEIEREALAARGVPREKMEILGMGVNPEDLDGGDGARFRRERGMGEGERIILFVGALIRDKGCFELVEAVRMLREKGMPVRLVMAGHPSREFTEYFSSLPAPLREACVLTGTIRGREKSDMFHACDLLAMPSRADSYGIVYLEAWAAGKPVIGAFAGGVPDVIRDGEDGFLVPFGDAHTIAEYMGMLLADSDLARRMGARGRGKVVAGYTWEKRYETVKGLFDHLVRGRGAKA